jgi:hypothetical protein
MRLLLMTSLLLTACGQASSAVTARGEARSRAPEGFWDTWGDGQAELVGYQLTQPRYGSARSGELILVTVTETFTHGQRVKSDGGHRDEYPVLKLNEVRDFQTGIYDYNVLTSTFVPLSGGLPLGMAEKISFSMQEWCGLTFAELTADHRQGGPLSGLALLGRGYFDGEAQIDRQLAAPEGGVLADALPVVVRGLAGDLLAPGERVEVPWLMRVMDARLWHRELDWSTATLSRSAAPAPFETPAGTFSAWAITAEPASDPATTWYVEDGGDRRLLGWESSSGERAVMTGSVRAPYWRQHDNGQEALRARLGLPAPSWPPRTQQ